MATVEELKKFLQENYEALQTLKNTNFVQNLRKLEKDVNDLTTQLTKKRNLLSQVTNPDGRTNINNEIGELQKDLKNAKKTWKSLEKI